jgi:hypothetical protein
VRALRLGQRVDQPRQFGRVVPTMRALFDNALRYVTEHPDAVEMPAELVELRDRLMAEDLAVAEVALSLLVFIGQRDQELPRAGG